MKKHLHIHIDRTHPAAALSCGIMGLAALIRLIYYLSASITAEILFLHLSLPVMAAVLFIIGTLTGGRPAIPLSIAAVILGIAFFVLKAFRFTPLHQTLCTILYITVLTLYTLTVSGYLPTKKLLYPLFGLPLLYHIFVEDTRLYFFADPPVPVWDWMPEISVLCIMAALLTQTAAMQTEKITP